MQARIKAIDGRAVTPARIYGWREYVELCKPRVIALMVFTSLVGMFLATPDFVPMEALLFGTIGIGFMAGAAAAINHLVDQRIDGVMRRTMGRPLPTGRMDATSALVFVLLLGAIGLAVLALLVNQLTALLTLLSLVGYSGVYTLYLKRATPQNIVIGGAAGAMPPVLGWTAVTGQIDPHALLLFLIIFAWTPPHFWALAIHRRSEYARAGVPMLPVTHGVAFTRLQILLYTIILVVVTLLPFATRMSGWLYLGGALLLNIGFLYYAFALWLRDNPKLPMKTFGYSIIYLMGLFALLLLDHYLLI